MPLFKRIPFYIKIYADYVEITNLVTEETITGTPEKAYYMQRSSLADFNRISLLIETLLEKMGVFNGVLPKQIKVLVQQMEEVEGGLMGIEKRAMRDLGEQAGATEVRIVTHCRKLSSEEALLQFKAVDNF